MIAVDMDFFFQFWGTQGLTYYMAARLMTRPELTVERRATVAQMARADMSIRAIGAS